VPLRAAVPSAATVDDRATVPLRAAAPFAATVEDRATVPLRAAAPPQPAATIPVARIPSSCLANDKEYARWRPSSTSRPGPIATITLNRPDRLNTIVPPMPDEFEAATADPAAMKLIVNQAYENMGLRTTQTLGPILDGLMRNTPDGLDFVHTARDAGVRTATAQRDAPFGDYTAAEPERRPDPSHVITP
jgi:hypothetical protein